MNKGLINLISSNKLFEGVEISNINFDGINGNLLTYSEGTLIFSEGEPSNEVFLVMDGKVNVLRKSNLGVKGDEIFEKDSFFGFEEFIENVSRISTAIAVADSYLIAFNREEARALIRQNEKLKENIVKYSNIPDVEQIHHFLAEAELKEEEIKESVEEEKTVDELTEETPETENEKNVKQEISQPSDLDFDLEMISPPIGEEEEKDVQVPDEMLNYYTGAAEVIEEKAPEEKEEEKEESPKEEESKTEVAKPEQEERSSVIEESPIDLPDDLWGDEEPTSTEPPMDTTFDAPPISPFEEEPTTVEKEEPKEEAPVEEEIKIEEVEEEKEKGEDKTSSFVLDVADIIERMDKIFLSSNKKELVSNFTALLKSGMNVEVSLFFLPDVKGNLVAEFEKDNQTVQIVEPLENSSIGKSFKNNSPQIISLPEEWEKLETSELQRLNIEIRNLLIYPVRTAVEKVGVVVLINKLAGDFSEEDLNYVRRFKELFEARLKQFDFQYSQFLTLKENIYQRLVNFLSGNVKEKIVLAEKYNQKALAEDEPKSFIEMAIEQLQKARGAIGDVDFLKVENKDLHLVELDLKDFVEKFFEEKQELFKAKYINVFKNNDAEAFVKIDPSLMTVALTKICENACESMPFGGNIVFKSFVEGETVVLSFSDNGNGIDEENISLIFEPFVAFAKEGHSGLGLAVAKKIIEAHGGEISAKINEKQGVTVEIKLPAVQF